MYEIILQGGCSFRDKETALNKAKQALDKGEYDFVLVVEGGREEELLAALGRFMWLARSRVEEGVVYQLHEIFSVAPRTIRFTCGGIAGGFDYALKMHVEIEPRKS